MPITILSIARPLAGVAAQRRALVTCLLAAVAVAAAGRPVGAQVANRPPVASQTGPFVSTSRNIPVDGTRSSDPDGDALTYAWTFGDGTTGTGAKLTHEYPKRGLYTITLIVTDSKGAASAPVSTTADVHFPPVAAVGGPYTGNAGTAVQFDGSLSSDRDGDALTYAWTFGDGTTGTGVRPTRVYAAAGTFTVGLIVTDARGAASPKSSTTATIAAPTVANRAPTAAPGGPYTGAEGSAVALSGTGSSDPDGDALTYAWTFGDGGTSTQAAPSHSYAQSGSYAATLVVTDARGAASAAATATVTVANVAPAASAALSASSITAGGSVTLTGSFTDPAPGDGPWSYTIDWGDASPAGTGSVTSPSAGISASHSYPTAGSYSIALRVQDKDGGAGDAPAQALTVTAAAPPVANRAPVAAPGASYTGSEGAAVQLDGSASSDPDTPPDLPLTYAWNFGDGTTGSGAQPAHVYAQSGPYTVSLVVTDARGLASTAATTSATIANVAPTVTAALSATSVATGTAVTLTGSFTDPAAGDSPWAYSIDWGDGTASDAGSAATTATAISGTHSYAASGSYTVALLVRDKDGGEGSARRALTVTAPVANRAPTAAPGGPYTGREGTAALFDGSASSDPDGDALTYAWDFGDGTTGTGAQPTHVYAQSGPYTVGLTVTDAKGAASALATATATVADVAPTVTAALSTTTITAGGTVTLTGSFTDPAPADGPWSYTINWGDGTPVGPASAAVPSTNFTASHSYATAGSYSVALRVQDKDGVAGDAPAQALTVTAPPTATSAVVLIAGDIADCGRNTDELTAKILDRHPDATIITAGDNVYPAGTLDTYNNCYGPSWGSASIKSRTWAAVGNHEYEIAAISNAEGHAAYFGPRAGPASKFYYTITVGDWQIFVLNSEISFSATSPQTAWLKAELAKSTKKCTMAVWHRPRFYSGTTSTGQASLKALWDVLYAADADLAIAGHRHHYERFAPQTPTAVADPVRGIRQIIVGTGGKNPASFGTPAPNSEVREAGAFGVLKLTLGSDGYSWEFIPAETSSFRDVGEGTCH